MCLREMREPAPRKIVEAQELDSDLSVRQQQARDIAHYLCPLR
jgi:hypothetical protein